MNRININDPTAWQELDWDDQVQPDILKKSDRAVNTARQNRLKAQDPNFIEKLKTGQKKVLNDPKKVDLRNQAAKKGGDTKRNSKEYQQSMTEVNRKKAQDSTFRENVSIGIKKKHQDPVYQEKMRKKAESQSYKIKDPNGKIWNNANEAGQAWFPNPDRPAGPSRKVRNLISKSNSGWSKI